LFTTGTSVVPPLAGSSRNEDDEDEVNGDKGRLHGDFGGKKKRSVANGGLKSVSALLKKLSGPLIVLRHQAQTNKK
jgi:hypothetical protein